VLTRLLITSSSEFASLIKLVSPGPSRQSLYVNPRTLAEGLVKVSYSWVNTSITDYYYLMKHSSRLSSPSNFALTSRKRCRRKLCERWWSIALCAEQGRQIRNGMRVVFRDEDAVYLASIIINLAWNRGWSDLSRAEEIENIDKVKKDERYFVRVWKGIRWEESRKGFSTRH